jgi:hypothetical protein
VNLVLKEIVVEVAIKAPLELFVRQYPAATNKKVSVTNMMFGAKYICEWGGYIA